MVSPVFFCCRYLHSILVSSCIINIISCILGVLYLHCINLLGRLLDTTGCHDFVAFSLVSLPSISLSSSQSKKQHDTYSSTSLGYYWCKSYLSFARAEHWTVRQKTINRIYTNQQTEISKPIMPANCLISSRSSSIDMSPDVLFSQCHNKGPRFIQTPPGARIL